MLLRVVGSCCNRLHTNLIPISRFYEAEGEIWSSKKIQFFLLARLWANDVNVVSCARYGVGNSFFVLSSVMDNRSLSIIYGSVQINFFHEEVVFKTLSRYQN